MKYLQIVEDLINKILLRILEAIRNLLAPLVPSKIKSFIQKPRNPKPLKERAKNLLPLLKKLIEMLKQLSGKLLGMLSILIIKLKQLDKTKLSPSKLFFLLVSILLFPLSKLKTWFFALKPGMMVGVIITGSIGALTTISVYQSATKIMSETSKNKVVEIEVIKPAKPKYQKISDKQLLISNVAMPIYIENAASLKTMLLDFTIETSNKYIVAYFLEKEHVVRDRLSNTLEPIVPEFPLSKEGKSILKEKIKNELNELLLDLHIKGKIIDVQFEAIIAG